MHLKKLLNPKFIYDRRNRIIPNLYKFIHLLQRHLAVKYSIMDSNNRSLASFKNKHKGRRCFIIGNGPSLRISDLQKLYELDEITFAFNKIYLAFNETEFRPSYYIAEDTFMVKNIVEEICSLEPFTKFFPYDYKMYFKGMVNTYFYYWELNSIFGSLDAFSSDLFHIRWGGTVTYTALQFASFFGCNPIYLIGCDFSFAVPSSRDPLDNEVVIGQGEQNHFHPDYRPVGEKWCAPKVETQLLSYKAAQNYAQKKNIKIYNATRGGCLEVFERKNLDDIMKK